MLVTVIAVILLGLGAGVAAFNCACVFENYRLMRQGVQRHVSTVPLIAQVVVLIAAVIASKVPSPLLPIWLFWAVALSDVALLQIFYLPVLFLRRTLHK